MAKDSSLYVRKGVIRLLKATPALVAIVGDRVYPPQRPANPLWPFVGYGVPTVAPFVASCLDGCEVRPAIHVYAATEGSGAATISGETRAHELLALVAATLDGAVIDLAAAEIGCPYPATAFLEWGSTQVIQDQASPAAFHGIGLFDIAVSS